MSYTYTLHFQVELMESSWSLIFIFLAGVKKGILEAVEQIGRDAPAVFTAGMTGIEMMENAVFY